jgi:hypothetical protein
VRALLDRPIAAVVAERLRDVGTDALAAVDDPALAALDDEGLFAHAGRVGRVLVSQNLGDHLALAERTAGEEPGRHPGLIVVSPVRYPRSLLVIDRLVRDLDAVLSGHDPQELSRRGVHWLETPPGCPFWPSG